MGMCMIRPAAIPCMAMTSSLWTFEVACVFFALMLAFSKPSEMFISSCFFLCSRSPSLDDEAMRICEHVTVKGIDGVIQNLRYVSGEGRWERGWSKWVEFGFMAWSVRC